VGFRFFRWKCDKLRSGSSNPEPRPASGRCGLPETYLGSSKIVGIFIDKLMHGTQELSILFVFLGFLSNQTVWLLAEEGNAFVLWIRVIWIATLGTRVVSLSLAHMCPKIIIMEYYIKFELFIYA
jgi:hypothetical protein